MHIAMLSRNRGLYSTTRLADAARERGHTLRILDPLRCYMRIDTGELLMHYRGENLPEFDAVIPRIGASITAYGCAVLRQFEMMGVYTLNRSDAFLRARDKLRALQMLAQKGIGLPATVYGNYPDDTHDLMTMLGSPPHVIKLVEGTQGTGVVLAEKLSASRSVIEAFRGLDANFLVQEFVREAQGADIRCFVIGGKVVAAMKRQAMEGEFRSNLHRGGHAEAITLTEQEIDTAVLSASVMGLSVAGVDVLRTGKGPLVIEVNASPGLEGIEGATGVNVADKIIEFIERRAVRHQTEQTARKAKPI